jgi:SAM-dependent methyltransferase
LKLYSFSQKVSNIFKENKNINQLKEISKYSLTSRNCVCGESSGTIIYDKDRYGLELDFILCKECGIVRIADKLSDKDLTHFYETHYRRLYFDMEEPSDSLVQNEQRPRGRAIVKIFRSENIELKYKKVLEIGAGAGGILDEFYSEGAITTAYEPSKKYCEYMRSFTSHHVIEGMFSSSSKDRLNQMQFNIIIISHVLEHVNEPKEFLLNAMKYLTPNGVLYIEVPSLTNIGLANDHLLDYFHVAHPWSFNKSGLLRMCNDINLSPVYQDNVIRVILANNSKTHRAVNCKPGIVFLGLIFQDILSRLGLLGFKRKILIKLTNIIPKEIKEFLKKFLNA